MLNRAGEAGEIGVGTAVNAATGGLAGAALDAGGAIKTEIENQTASDTLELPPQPQSTEGGE
jgi:hypothetical protein